MIDGRTLKLEEENERLKTELGYWTLRTTLMRDQINKLKADVDKWFENEGQG